MFLRSLIGSFILVSLLNLFLRKKVLKGLLLKIVLTLCAFLIGSSYQHTSSMSVILILASLRSHFIAFTGNAASCFISVNLSSSTAYNTLPSFTRQAAES